MSMKTVIQNFAKDLKKTMHTTESLFDLITAYLPKFEDNATDNTPIWKITTDGSKTWATILGELYTNYFDKITYNSFITFNGSKFKCSTIGTNKAVFTWTENSSSTVQIHTLVMASTGAYYFINGSFTVSNSSTSKPNNINLELYL